MITQGNSNNIFDEMSEALVGLLDGKPMNLTPAAQKKIQDAAETWLTNMLNKQKASDMYRVVKPLDDDYYKVDPEDTVTEPVKDDVPKNTSSPLEFDKDNELAFIKAELEHIQSYISSRTPSYIGFSMNNIGNSDGNFIFDIRVLFDDGNHKLWTPSAINEIKQVAQYLMKHIEYVFPDSVTSEYSSKTNRNAGFIIEIEPKWK